jgi:hypothetical protein
MGDVEVMIEKPSMNRYALTGARFSRCPLFVRWSPRRPLCPVRSSTSKLGTSGTMTLHSP